MFLTLVSAIALTVGSATTLNDLARDPQSLEYGAEPLVEVAPVQDDDPVESEIGW